MYCHNLNKIVLMGFVDLDYVYVMICMTVLA